MITVMFSVQYLSHTFNSMSHVLLESHVLNVVITMAKAGKWSFCVEAVRNQFNGVTQSTKATITVSVMMLS